MKKPQNKKSLVLLFAILFGFVISPVIAAAQYVVPKFPDAGEILKQRLYDDGSVEPDTVRQENIQNYRQQSNDFQQKVSALGATANASVFMPVLFGVGLRDISPNFGDPRSGGRTHKGEDIMAVKGTPIVSPTPAIVLRTGVGPTEGNYVYTANPGGETFVYMHLDRFAEGVVSGTVLSQGSLVGYVGNTGNASGGPAHLHFEIHNSSNVAMDPFPRLTGEFTLQEKITYLFAILNQTSDSAGLSQFLVSNFRGTFLNALAANITLPLSITDSLATIPIAPVAVTAAAVSSLPLGDLDIGSSGAAVTGIQTYLIKAASGLAASRLASAGATGYFGVITKAALVEFQALVGIAPPTGYYGATTRSFIAAHPTPTPVGTPISLPPGTIIPAEPAIPVTNVPVVSQPAGNTSAIFTRDLHKDLTGEDVRALQKLLNANGYIVATTGGGSPGNETNLFGPATLAAVIKFQIAKGISPAAGYVGPLTKAALKAL